MIKTKRVKTTYGGAGGYLVGRKHSQGGIKVQNKSTNEKVEVEGGEAIITAPALSDNKLHEFEGKQMTKRQILSAINVDAGGVSFEKGGHVPGKIRCTGKQYKFGGQTMTDHDIVSSCGCKHSMEKGGQIEHEFIGIATVKEDTIFKDYDGLLRQIKKDEKINIKSITQYTYGNRKSDVQTWVFGVTEQGAGLSIPKELVAIKKVKFSLPDQENELISELSKLDLPVAYKAYEGKPGMLLSYIQEQATGMIAGRKSVNTTHPAFKQTAEFFGEDITLKAVRALSESEKQMILKAWKGKELNPELRKALRTKTMEFGGQMSEGGSVGKSEKSDNFTSKGISHEVQHILSAEGENSNEALIYTIADYFRASKSASQQGQNKNLWKQQERKILLKYIDDNSIWIDNIWKDNYISEGAEQKVYLFNSEYVVKFNDGIFYSSWLDYLNSILIHNHYFPDTRYELIGFFKKDETIFSVLKQPFIQETSLTNPLHIKQFLTANGFINKKENNYYNPDIGIILEDLHQGNVLTKKGVPYFIDTVFYITDENGDIITYEQGGEIENQPIISKFQTDMENIDKDIQRQNKRLEETMLFALMGARNIVFCYEQKKISVRRLLIMLAGYEKDIKDYHAELAGIATEHSDNPEKLSSHINRHKHSFFSRNYSYLPDEYENADDEKLCSDARRYAEIVKGIIGKEAELWASIGEMRFFVVNELEEFINVCEELRSVKENILSSLGFSIEDINVTGSNYNELVQTIKDKIASLRQQKNRLEYRQQVLTEIGIELDTPVPEGTEERLAQLN